MLEAIATRNKKLQVARTLVGGDHRRLEATATRNKKLLVARTLVGGGHRKSSQVGWRPSLLGTRSY